jgi:alkylation response protein AidB-like acyl-CoA dehydrogenase
MDFHFTDEETAFREKVRSFFRTAQPEGIRKKMLRGQQHSREELISWHRILEEKGWGVTPEWPKEWGGHGWNAVQSYIYMEEMLRTPALPPMPHVNQVGPVLIAYGTDEQKARFLQKIRTLEIWFCQGFSEPGSGSDLASLKTRAVLDGDQYVVNGQKLWSSYAHYADWMYALVRTDPAARKQNGITYLLIDMKSPGISVHPVVTLDGHRHVNAIFFDNVRVPVVNRVGEENKGWEYAKVLLGHERMHIGRVGTSKGRISLAKQLISEKIEGDRLRGDERLQEKMAAIEVELKAIEITNMRVVDEIRKRKDAAQDPKISILKLKGSEMLQSTLELLFEIAGPHNLPRQHAFLEGEPVNSIGPEWAATAALNYYFGRSRSITSGTNEIQKNIIAKKILGL